MTRYAQAAILRELGAPLTIENIEIPELLYGQVLVKILYSGVCRSQLMEVKGLRGSDHWLPHLLGHEASGIVIGIGDGVTKVKSGDEVILGWIKVSGIDAASAKYKINGETINAGKVTTFSNYSVVSESRIVKKPASLAFDLAPLYGCALPTGGGMALHQVSSVKKKTVAVLGLGGIGLSALIILKSLGPRLIVAIDLSAEKLKLAAELGANLCLNSGEKDFIEKIHQLTNGGVDYCIESGGSVSTIELGFKILSKSGTLIFASHPPEGELIKIAPHELISGKKIEGSWGGETKPDIDILRMYNLIKKANIQLECLISKRYSLKDINEALNDLDKGEVFRPLITMEHPND